MAMQVSLQLANLLSTHLNPYTGKPMRYDAIKHEIAFEGQQEVNSNYAKSSTFIVRLAQ